MEAYMSPGSCLYYHCFQEHALARCAAEGMLVTAQDDSYFGGELPACARRFRWELSDMNQCMYSHPHTAPCVQMPGVGTAAGTCPFVPQKGLTRMQLVGIIVAASSLGVVLVAMAVGQCLYKQQKRGARAETNRLLVDGASGAGVGGAYGDADASGDRVYPLTPDKSSRHHLPGSHRSHRSGRSRLSTGDSSVRESASEGSQSDSQRGGSERYDSYSQGGRGYGVGRALRTPPRKGWAAPAAAGLGSLQGGDANLRGRDQ